jgi:hypothetical protein
VRVVRRTQAQAALLDRADAAPRAVAGLEHPGHHRLRGLVAAEGDRADELVLDLGASLLELSDQHQDALEQVDRLEPRDDERHAEVVRDRLVLAPALHRADVTGREEALDPVARRHKDRRDRRRHQHVRDQQREVPDPLIVRHLHRHRVGRRRRLEPHREEDHRLVRVPPRESRARRAASTRRGRRRRSPAP